MERRGWAPAYELDSVEVCVYICPVCGQPGDRGATCSNGAHEPPEEVGMIPSTALATAYQTYARARADPDAESGATIDQMESGEIMPSPPEIVRFAEILGQPVYYFFVEVDEAMKILRRYEPPGEA